MSGLKFCYVEKNMRGMDGTTYGHYGCTGHENPEGPTKEQ